MRRALILLVLVLTASLVQAQTVTITEETIGVVKKVRFAWTVDAAGDATGTTVGAYNGKIEVLVTDPGAGPPTDNYDIVVTDEDGYDTLAGAGANRDTATTETVLASTLGVVANDKLTLTVAAAGNATSGVVVVYIR